MPSSDLLKADALLRPVEESDLAMLLGWRNDERVRTRMLSQHIITRGEHLDWFKRARTSSTRRLFVVELNGQPFGFVHFDLISHDCAEWGFYKNPDAPRGRGLSLATAALKHAFGALKLARVRAVVLSNNAVSLAFHKRLGFKTASPTASKPLSEPHIDPIIHLELRSSEWGAHKPPG